MAKLEQYCDKDGQKDQMNRLQPGLAKPSPRWILWLLFLLPASAWAHGIPPEYFPLGHFPFMALFGGEWTYSIPLISVSVLGETLFLWAWRRRARVLGHLGAAAGLYLVARATETALLFLVLAPLVNTFDWTASAFEEWGWLIVLLAGLAGVVPAGLWWYRKLGEKTIAIVLVVIHANFTGYIAGLCFVLLRERLF